MHKVTLVVFKELREADLRKLRAQSNDSATGGGARDLRFRPYNSFDRAFERLFPEVVNERRKREGRTQTITVRRGTFYWTDAKTGAIMTEEAQFEPPTSARPGEGRLVRVHDYPHLREQAELEPGKRVLLLVQDESGAVWPYVVTEASLRNNPEWDVRVAELIIQCLERTKHHRAPQGYIDLTTGTHYCNE